MKLHLIDKELQYQQTQINELQHELNLRKLTPKAFPKHSSDFIPPNIQNTITHLQNENTDLKTKLSENEKIIQEFHTIMKDAYTKMEHLYKLNELLHAENTKLQTELTKLKAHHHNSNYQNVKCFVYNDVPYLDDDAHKQCVNRLREKIIEIEKRFNTKYNNNTNCIVGSSFRDYTHNSRIMKRTNYFKHNNKDISKISITTNVPNAFNTNCSSVHNLNTIEHDDDNHCYNSNNNKYRRTRGKLNYPHSFTAGCHCNSNTHSNNKQQQQQSRNSIHKD